MILEPYQPESDLYALLEVSPAAADEEVKGAFYRAIRKVHPDLNTGKSRSTFKTQRINQAKILLNTGLRAQYDRLRAEFLATRGEAPSRPRPRRKPRPRRRVKAASPARHTKPLDRRTWERLAVAFLHGLISEG
ncbi:MAG TPA: J domain-containing protein [Myxococcaceae bacterium]|nr:J domain-containing protein [Myxococcaceae bacterium]